MSLLEAISPTAKELLACPLTRLHCDVANWNGTHDIGSPVRFTQADGTIVNTITSSQAWVSFNRDALIKLVGIDGPQFLNRVQAVTGRQS